MRGIQVREMRGYRVSGGKGGKWGIQNMGLRGYRVSRWKEGTREGYRIWV